MSTQAGIPSYEFLSKPPQQKRRVLVTCQPPSLPLPPTPPSENRKDTIVYWAEQVQPGSPQTPSPRRSSLCSSPPPSRRPSFSHRSSSRRRLSSSRIAHIRVPSHSSSFLHLIDTPSTGHHTTPSFGDFVPNTADLAKHGYTTVVVSLPPTTPQSAVPFKTTQPQPAAEPMQPTSAKPTKTLHRFRSLSILRPSRRARSGNAPASPTKRTTPPSPTKRSRSRTPSKPVSPTTAQRERKAKNRKAPLPPPLVNELMLMQFMDGGKLDSHAPRVLAEGDAVFRDGKGGLWRDGDEEGEYAGLLASANDSESQRWVAFNGGDSSPMAILDFSSEDADIAGPGRRGSEGSMDTAELIRREPMVIDHDVGKIVWLPSVATKARQLRQRPAPLNIVPPSTGASVIAFEDSFAPSPVAPSPEPSCVTPPSSESTTAVESEVSIPRMLKTKRSMGKLQGSVKSLFKGVSRR